MDNSSTKVALITYAAGIIGPDICAALQKAGWKVAAVDRDREKFSVAEKALGHPFPADLQLTGDLAQREDCLRFVEQSRRGLGPLSLLIHGTHASQCRPFAEIDEALWERVMRVDISAPFYITQEAAPDLAETRGLIVHLSSARVNNVVVPGSLPYIVAKAAMEKMVECLAVELAPQGIRVNGIRIGAVFGDGVFRAAMDLLPPDLAARLRAELLPRFRESLRGCSLIGGTGFPSDIASMILYLASPGGSIYQWRPFFRSTGPAILPDGLSGVR